MDNNQVLLMAEAMHLLDDLTQYLLYDFLDTSSNSRHYTITVTTSTGDAAMIETCLFLERSIFSWRSIEHRAHPVLLCVADVPLARHLSQILRRRATLRHNSADPNAARGGG